MPDSSAASPSPREFSIAVKRLHDIHQWVTSGIAETLDKPGGAFLLGVESEAIIGALDYIEGYIYNLEDELDADRTSSAAQGRRWPLYAFLVGLAISGSLDLAAYLSGAFNG